MVADPRFFPFYPGKAPRPSFSRERIEEELKGKELSPPYGTGLAKLSSYRRVFPLTEKVKEVLSPYVDSTFLEKADFAVVQGKLEVLPGTEETVIGYSPAIALTDKNGVPYCTASISVKEFYDLLGVKPEVKVPEPEERETFRERLKEGLLRALKLPLPKEGRENAERALYLLKKGKPLEEVLTKGLTLKEHQAKEALRIAGLLEKGESSLLGWEMRGGKTLTSLVAFYLSGRKGALVFRSANVLDVLNQVSLRAPFILNSLAALKVSGLDLKDFPVKTYDALGRVVPNFQAFLSRKERELAEKIPDYGLFSSFVFRKGKFGKRVEKREKEISEYLKSLTEKGYDEELTKGALAFLLEYAKKEKIPEILDSVKPVSLYDREEEFVLIPASRVSAFSFTDNKKDLWLSVPDSFDGILVDEADLLAGIESSNFEGLLALSERAKVRLFMTGTLTSGYPESAVALTGLLAGKSKSFIKSAVKEAEKELGVFSLPNSARGKAVSFALTLWKNGKDSLTDLTEEERLFYREVEKAFAFDVKEKESPKKVVRKVLETLTETGDFLEACGCVKVSPKREMGTLNPIAFAHSVAPVYLSLASRESLHGIEERLIFDLENAEKTLALKGEKERKDLFADGSYDLRKAVDTAYERFKERALAFKDYYPFAKERLEEIERENPEFRRKTGTSKDGLVDLFVRRIFFGKEAQDERKRELINDFVLEFENKYGKLYEKVVFKRSDWPTGLKLPYSPFLGRTEAVVDSFSNLLLFRKVREESEKGKSLLITGAFIAPNAFYLLDAMVSAKSAVFIWRKTGTAFDKFLLRVSKVLGRELVVAGSTALFEKAVKEKRKEGQVIAATVDSAVSRGADFSAVDLMVVTSPNPKLSVAVQLYSRLFSVERTEAEIFLFGTYLRTYSGKVYPSKSFYTARKTYDSVLFTKAVLDGELPLTERAEFQVSPYGHSLELEENLLSDIDL